MKNEDKTLLQFLRESEIETIRGTSEHCLAIIRSIINYLTEREDYEKAQDEQEKKS